MLKLLGVKEWLIAALAAIVLIGSSYALGHWRGDTAGSAREAAAWTAKQLELVQNHGRQIAAREAEKRALQDKVVAAEIDRQASSQARILPLYPDLRNDASAACADPDVQRVLEGLR